MAVKDLRLSGETMMHRSFFLDTAKLNNRDFLHVSENDDFSKQAALQGFFNATQLASGAFDGQLMQANIGQTTVFVDYSNLPLEKHIRNTSSDLIFVIATKQKTIASSYGGVKEPNDVVKVIPPGGQTVRLSQPEQTTLVLKVDHSQFLMQLNHYPYLDKWFRSLETCAVLNSTWLAERLRSDSLLALEGATAGCSAEQLEAIDRVVMKSVVHAFALEHAARHTLFPLKETAAVERFYSNRATIAAQLETLRGAAMPESLTLHGSKRSVEKAFACCVKMGPLAYARVVRLHKTRGKLMDVRRLDQTIGDIAAEDGFWEWSRFAKYYGDHFGELPSKTRERALV